ncbi:hypothetical protein OO006_12675 [Prosthecochloris sp. SCSIO W1101]|uniref:hypothetical protein n=1 Tax=Prosthecochloris sp. SCSIO W1101 TaxID=2992242 RepID=UPI00223C8ECA|nr:hypothetical protein [Prosthecochloris sp. SCSIO W1101]UZJ41184.1 hypothetical protein OO006_12675 [Prosthecochloris sp. SCSIO W1101]
MGRSNAVRGMKGLKTIGGLKRRASNSDRTQAHLDIYVLVQERDRLEKEKSQVLSRLESIDERLTTINDRIDELKAMIDWSRAETGRRKSASARQNRKTQDDKEDGGKTWQVKNLQY